MEKSDSRRTGRGKDATSSSTVLIDNSTYFSARNLLYEGDLDAYTVYNLANLLECLVITEGVVLSPTLAWKPSRDDTLFGKKGPCTTLNAEDWTEADLAKLFTNALEASLRDCASRTALKPLGLKRTSSPGVAQLLKTWRSQARSDPQMFLEQYSGAVYLTDDASKRVVANLNTATTTKSSTDYHLAQFLLRANFAYELSATWAYHPHSHRLHYVASRMRRDQRETVDLGRALLKDTELRMRKEISRMQQSALLRNFGAFTHETQLPLVLSAVLSQASTPDDIIPVTMEIRGQRSAKRYRKWISEMISAIDSLDFRRQAKAEQELRASQEILGADLRSLYMPKDGPLGLIQRGATYAGTLDPKIVETINLEGGLEEVVASGTVSAIPALVEWVHKRGRRRNIVFLLDLVYRRQGIEALNPLLYSVFGKKLDQEQLRKLYDLRADQGKGIAAIAALGAKA